MEWIDWDEKRPEQHPIRKYKVKTSNRKEFEAFYHADGNAWRCFYGYKLCFWCDCNTGKPIYDVTHWKYKDT